MDSKYSKIATREVEQGIELTELPRLPRWMPWLPMQTSEFIRRESKNFDHALFFSVFIPAHAFAARLLRCPYATCPMGGYTPESVKARGHLRKRFFLALSERAFINRARFVNTWSELENAGVQAISRPRNFVVTPPGFSMLEKVPPHGPFHEPGNRVVAYLGRLAIKQKGLDVLIPAFQRCAGRGDTLCIVGPDFLRGRRDLLRSMASRPPGPGRVTFGDRIERDEIKAYFSGTDIFVHLSRWEGLPSALVEALAHGLPAVVTEGTNAGEFIRRYEAGWVVKGDDCESALREAMNAPTSELERRSANARRLVAEVFRWDNAADKLLTAMVG
jgi:glycosyltransferase involved in cell wall biosynthesis